MCNFNVARISQVFFSYVSYLKLKKKKMRVRWKRKKKKGKEGGNFSGSTVKIMHKLDCVCLNNFTLEFYISSFFAIPKSLLKSW